MAPLLTEPPRRPGSGGVHGADDSTADVPLGLESSIPVELNTFLSIAKMLGTGGRACLQMGIGVGASERMGQGREEKRWEEGSRERREGENRPAGLHMRAAR